MARAADTDATVWPRGERNTWVVSQASGHANGPGNGSFASRNVCRVSLYGSARVDAARTPRPRHPARGTRQRLEREAQEARVVVRRVPVGIAGARPIRLRKAPRGDRANRECRREPELATPHFRHGRSPRVREPGSTGRLDTL